MERVSRLRHVLLTTGAVLGSLCLVAALAGVLFGIKPLMFRSGSMEPAISTGGLALSIPVHADEIRVGDIVSTGNSAGTRITHRVIAVTPADGYSELTLKGDANDVVDSEIYPVTEVDRVFWAAPLLGYAVAWLNSSVALFSGGLLTAYLVYVAFGPKSRGDAEDEDDPDGSRPLSGRHAVRSSPSRSKHTLHRRASMAVSAGLIVTGGVLHTSGPARASFTDVAKATAQVTAGNLAQPTMSCSQAGGLLGLLDSGAVQLTWMTSGVVAPKDYFYLVTSSPGAADSTARFEPTVTSTIVRATDITGSSGTVTFNIFSGHHAWRSKPGVAHAKYERASLSNLYTPTLRCASSA